MSKIKKKGKTVVLSYHYLINNKTRYRIAKEIGVTPSHLFQILSGVVHASLPTAVKIEKASNGEIRVEDIISPEVKAALIEYLQMRGVNLNVMINKNDETN